MCSSARFGYSLDVHFANFGVDRRAVVKLFVTAAVFFSLGASFGRVIQRRRKYAHTHRRKHVLASSHRGIVAEDALRQLVQLLQPPPPPL
jgi:hypothetical protein